MLSGSGQGCRSSCWWRSRSGPLRPYSSGAGIATVRSARRVPRRHTLPQDANGPRLEHLQCTRSVTRCSGPARQSEVCWLKMVHDLEIDSAAVMSQGPFCMKSLLIVHAAGSEDCTCGAEPRHLHRETAEVTLHLTVSKTDVKASGVKRSGGCVCGGRGVTPSPCCSFVQHLFTGIRLGRPCCFRQGPLKSSQRSAS